MIELEEMPYRITEKDPLVKWVAPTTVVVGSEFPVFELQVPPAVGFVFEKGMQAHCILRTTETGNPEIASDLLVKIVKRDPTKYSAKEIVVAPYGQWRELVNALMKLYQPATWKCEEAFWLQITYIPVRPADILHKDTARLLLECIRIAPKLV